MTYVVETSKRMVSYAAEDGTSLEGNCRVLWDHGTETDTFSPDETDGFAEPYESPVAWAVELINRTDAYQSSTDPVPAEVPEHDWLAGTYTDPYDNNIQTETHVYLRGDWTPAQRSAVYRTVYNRAMGREVYPGY